MSRDHFAFMSNTKLRQCLTGMSHGFPIRLATHDDGDEGKGRWRLGDGVIFWFALPACFFFVVFFAISCFALSPCRPVQSLFLLTLAQRKPDLSVEGVQVFCLDCVVTTFVYPA